VSEAGGVGGQSGAGGRRRVMEGDDTGQHQGLVGHGLLWRAAAPGGGAG
jgi:hypothetical protein